MNRKIALLIILVFSLIFAACSQREPNEFGSPESATYAALEALATADYNPEMAWAFLDSASRNLLKKRAEEARAAEIKVEHPVDMLRVGHVPNRADIDHIERQRVTNSRVELTLHTALDKKFPLTLYRDESLWTISLQQD